MTQDEALAKIELALQRSVLESDPEALDLTTLSPETNLADSLDSLDSMVFLAELSDQTGITFPEGKAAILEILQVKELISYMIGHAKS